VAQVVVPIGRGLLHGKIEGVGRSPELATNDLRSVLADTGIRHVRAPISNSGLVAGGLDLPHKQVSGILNRTVARRTIEKSGVNEHDEPRRAVAVGMYIDDNLAYANCPLWKEHGHPQKVYDCLIELHEVNWRRRQLLHAKCPHSVLIDHCSAALVLPVICDFDVHLYGEGYGFAPLEAHWAQFSLIKAMDAQGCHWAGGKESERCATELAYNYDLLTGGGQYCYSDWRLWPKKFPYASGVTKEEPLFVKAYTLAQYYFGIYESRPYYFADSASPFSASTPLTYATIYRNDVWKDYLVVLANMNAETKGTSLAFRSPDRLGLRPGGRYALLDVNDRKSRDVAGDRLLKEGLGNVRVPGRGMKLFYPH